MKEISKIKIKKILDSNGYYYKADVFLKSGEQKKIEIGNIDFFLENLEKVQNEQNVPVTELIPLEFQIKKTWIAIYEHYYNFIYGAVTFILILGFIKRFSSETKMMNKEGRNNIFGIGKHLHYIYHFF